LKATIDFLESNNSIFLKATIEFSKRQWNFQSDNGIFKTTIGKPEEGHTQLGRPVIAGENLSSELQPTAGEFLRPHATCRQPLSFFSDLGFVVLTSHRHMCTF
jgi:hypothetical protein